MANKVLDALFPHHCILCSTRSDNGYPVCKECLAGLMPNTHCCNVCALPMLDTAKDIPAKLCAGCLLETPPYHRVVAPWIYDEQMAYLIHRWKFNKERRLTPLLAMLWLEKAPQDMPSIDTIVPVPLHWLRLLQRGFNQSEILCHQLHHQSPRLRGIALKARLAKRSRSTRSQAAMSITGRAQNIVGAFDVRQTCQDQKIAIVDDVMTTGSTAAEMAKTLLGAGARSVEVWCLARTPAPTI